MCIRDSLECHGLLALNEIRPQQQPYLTPQWSAGVFRWYTCLLYTSDAADERSSVDLGGRRIIKKKKNTQKYDGARCRKSTTKRDGIT